MEHCVGKMRIVLMLNRRVHIVTTLLQKVQDRRMDFNQPLVVVGTGRSSASELWAGVANSDSPLPASPHFIVGWRLAGKGEYLLATPA